MKTIVKGLLGAVTVIAIVAFLGGYGYAQPLPFRAQIPNTTDYALMNLKMTAQCTEQATEVITGTTFTATAKKATYTEKDIMGLLSKHSSACLASGAFPADMSKAKLYYQYAGSVYTVKVSDGTPTGTATISATCLSLSPNPAVYVGTENVITTTNSAKVSMVYNLIIQISIYGTASADGLVVQLAGEAKENLNLPKLDSKGKQTLTDSWSFDGAWGYGQAYALTVPRNIHCTSTAHANGSFKR